MNLGTKEAPVFDRVEIPKPTVPFPDLTLVRELVDPDVIRAGDIRTRPTHDMTCLADVRMNAPIID